MLVLFLGLMAAMPDFEDAGARQQGGGITENMLDEFLAAQEPEQKKRPWPEIRSMPANAPHSGPAGAPISMGGVGRVQGASPPVPRTNPPVPKPGSPQPNIMNQLVIPGVANNRELNGIAQAHIEILKKLFQNSPDAFKYFMQMMGSYGIADPDALGLFSSDLPDPKALISTLDEALAFYTRLKKFMRDILMRTRQYILKGKTVLAEKVEQLNHIATELEEVKKAQNSTHSGHMKEELGKEVNVINEHFRREMENYKRVKEWNEQMREGVADGL